MNEVSAGRAAELTGEPSTARPSRRGPRRSRPAFALLVAVTLITRVGREMVGRVAWSRFGFLGVVGVGAIVLVIMLSWRAAQRHRIRRGGGEEFSAEVVLAQLAASGLREPAFTEDGSLLGASVLVVNQHPKLLEVNTAYDIFGSDGRPLGAVRQFGQSRGKQLARVLTAFDQYFTHHFELTGPDGRVVLRLSRPRKVFKTKVHVFDDCNRYIGTIRQQNVFWKIRFELLDAGGERIGMLRADNLKAWDFHVFDGDDVPVATIFKSWEGWAQTAFTRADRYVVRIDRMLRGPLRSMTIAAALSVDLALKQDARGLL